MVNEDQAQEHVDWVANLIVGSMMGVPLWEIRKDTGELASTEPWVEEVQEAVHITACRMIGIDPESVIGADKEDVEPGMSYLSEDDPAYGYYWDVTSAVWELALRSASTKLGNQDRKPESVIRKWTS